MKPFIVEGPAGFPRDAGPATASEDGGRIAARGVRSMNPFVVVFRRPITSLVLVAGLVAGGSFALKRMGVDISPALNTSRIHAAVPALKASWIHVVLDYFGMGAGKKGKEEPSHEEHRKIVVTSPAAKEVVITQRYVCQIHSQRHIEVRAMAKGYIDEILVKEGQAVKKGDLMFKILPIVYQANLDAELAEARLAQLEFNNTRRLSEGNLPVVSKNEVMLLEAKLKKAQAKAKLAGAELSFTNVTARFDGIVDRQRQQLGSLVEEGDILTTLSDNRVMWVYFNVREAQYLEYEKASRGKSNENSNLLKLPDSKIELVLADGSKFGHDAGDTVTVEGKFNNETGNIAFRADFPNPDGLLRHGQTGMVLVHRTIKDALVIPQRATYELLDKRYVYVIGEDHVARQRLIDVEHELEDTFVVKSGHDVKGDVIKSGLDVKDKIVLEGVREVRDGDKVEFEFSKPEEVLANQKYHAE
jgi:membrane fusion protein, multidrug efflux system